MKAKIPQSQKMNYKKINIMLKTEQKQTENSTFTYTIEVLNNLLNESRSNAEELIEEANILYKHEKYARAYFLGYTANEEISKGQIIADFVMGVCSEKEFLNSFIRHKLKSSYTDLVVNMEKPYTLQYSDVNSKVFFKQRNNSLYVDFDNGKNINSPKDYIKKENADQMIQFSNNRLIYIYKVEEFNGRIGSKAHFK